MTEPYKYFLLDELKCKCGKCGSTGCEMDHDFMGKMDSLREAMEMPLIITSPYRCSAHNNNVNPKTGANGPHTTGKASDILIRGADAYRLVQIATQLGFTGIGVKQSGINRYIHLDTLKAPEYPRPWIWSYGDK